MNGILARLAVLLAAIQAGGCDRAAPSPEATALALSVGATGGEPRAALAASLAEGARQTLALGMRMAMTLQYGGENVPATAVPETRTQLDFTVASGSELAFRVGETAFVADGTDPKLAEGLKRDFRAQNPAGARGTAERLHGGVGTVRMDLPPKLAPSVRQFLGNLRQGIRQIGIPRPAEPLGVGATWTATGPVELNDMQLAQDARYRVVRIENGVAVVAVEVELHALPQVLALPQAKAGDRCQLSSAVVKGAGEVAIAPDQPLPISGRLDYAFDLKLDVLANGTSQQLDGHVDLALRW